MTPQERENKLRDALEKFSNNYQFWEVLSEQELFDNLIKFIKTKDVSEFIMAERPDVDLKNVAVQIWPLIPRKCDSHGSAMSVAEAIIDELKPYLKPVPESKFEGDLKEQFEGMCVEFGTCADTCEAYFEFFLPFLRPAPKVETGYIRNMILDLANDNNWQLSVDKLLMYLEKYLHNPAKPKKLTVAQMRDIEQQLFKNEISYSRMVEIINEFFYEPAMPIHTPVKYVTTAGGYLIEDSEPNIDTIKADGKKLF